MIADIREYAMSVVFVHFKKDTVIEHHMVTKSKPSCSLVYVDEAKGKNWPVRHCMERKTGTSHIKRPPKIWYKEGTPDSETSAALF